jgi:C1A family cysteine protease
MEVDIIVDLRDRLGMIRDQGKRPTCMAFAASDAHSFARASSEPLSVEYAFFHAINRTVHKDRTRGIAFRHVSEAISKDGQPLEADWSYLTNLSAGDDWSPPATVGRVFYRNSNKLAATMPVVYAGLDEGHPMILTTNIGISFYQPNLKRLVLQPSTERTIATHALLAVGYAKIERDRCVLVRNSWGERWADKGYAWVHEGYLKTRLLGVGAMV